jgi:hypothetical protein
MASGDAAAMAESRARMIRMESEADAQRYAEQSDKFRATQKLTFLKNGVELSGSPLDVLDETARTARENLSAIRAGGDARAFEEEMNAVDARIKGRSALIGGFIGASKTGLGAAGVESRNAYTERTARNNTNPRAGY